jgi:hypothetical protein
MLHTGPPQGMHEYIKGEGKKSYTHWCLEEYHEPQILLAGSVVHSPVSRRHSHFNKKIIYLENIFMFTAISKCYSHNSIEMIHIVPMWQCIKTIMMSEK